MKINRKMLFSIEIFIINIKKIKYKKHELLIMKTEILYVNAKTFRLFDNR